ncbi:MAG: DNA polymerase/3'-5' exonuclease PolX [Pedobacter sp.]|nr:MAG: DNA polymerase/3'-5' exonuclease PolX [Pedobacter sp.]
MENKQVSRTLRLLSQLMELHEQNPFKIKSIANAAFTIDKLPFSLKDKPQSELESIQGVGKSIAAKVSELFETGSIAEMNELLAQTPEGVIEMLGIKGIGPKKIAVIWHDLGIENIGELYYACNENRLVEAKGFGLKTQDDISRMIEFKLAANGKFIYARAEPIAKLLFEKLSLWLNQFFPAPLLGIAGEMRRCCEIIDQLDLVVGVEDEALFAEQLPGFEGISLTEVDANKWSGITDEGLKVFVHIVPLADFYINFFKFTGNDAHVAEVLKLAGPGSFSDENEIYKKAGLQFIEPELREDLGELALAAKNALPSLITVKDLKGSLHNHSTWSDGVNTLEEMALFCKEVLKLAYLGISDHSKTAFYARGLTEQQIFRQHNEIDALNKKLSPFKIFKGIESDILGDGSLDYDEHILKSFDFIVASIHSNLKMTEEKATTRLIKAIENPYTTILGHPTGRLLLSRAGYTIDHKKVIDACAANNVVIEINANPLRLDLDWRWHRYATEKGVILSVNPDAHRCEGFYDMHYGVLAGRKGGLTANNCLNALSLEEITAFFERKKS